jgi:hypothetical protein
MPRKVRLEYPGAIYHVMSRGDQRQDIFLAARPEAAEAKAQRMVAEELARLHWTQNDLATQQKSYPIKLALAARLRRETTLSVKQIAALLHLGKPKGGRTNLHKFMHAQPGGPRTQ